MPDTVTLAERTERTARTTSMGIWLLVIALTVALLLLRLPSFIAVAEASLAAETATLDDDALSGAAIAVGASAAVALHALGTLLVAALATVLERIFGPRALGARQRLGVGGAALAVLVLGQQVAAAVLGVASVARGPQLWILGGIVALSTPLAFPAARASLRAYARALVVTGTIGGLLCIG